MGGLDSRTLVISTKKSSAAAQRIMYLYIHIHITYIRCVYIHFIVLVSYEFSLVVRLQNFSCLEKILSSLDVLMPESFSGTAHNFFPVDQKSIYFIV